MNPKLKSIREMAVVVLGVLGINLSDDDKKNDKNVFSKLSTKEGKLELSQEQRDLVSSAFESMGEDFMEKFESSFIAAQQAIEHADSEEKIRTDAEKNAETKYNDLLEAAKKDFNTKLESITTKMTDDFNQKLKALGDLPTKEKVETIEKEVMENAGKKVYKIEATHMHNDIAMKMLTGMSYPTATTIDTAALKAEFGAIVTQDKDFIMKKLVQPTVSEKYMTTKMSGEIWAASEASVTSVVQQFSNKYTPLGAGKVTPIKIYNRHHKINISFVPSEILGTWVASMYDSGLSPKDMPITKFMIDLVLEKAAEDRELILIGKGEYVELNQLNINTNDPGQATGGSMDGFMTILRKEYENANTKVNFINLGILSDTNVVDKFKDFIKGIKNSIFKGKPTNVFVSEDLYGMYKNRYQELFPATKNIDSNDDKLNFTQKTLAQLPSMAGLTSFFTTTKENFIRLIDKNVGSSNVSLQEVDYEVKIFAEWWEAVGFAVAEMIWAYIDPLWVLDGYAKKNDASKLLVKMLIDAGCTGVNANKLAAYKTAIAAADEITSLTQLQGIVTAANA